MGSKKCAWCTHQHRCIKQAGHPGNHRCACAEPALRRRPTDSERIDVLLKWLMRGYDLHELHMFPTRATLDRMSRQLREEAKK